MGQPLSPEEEKTFENLWSKFTQQPAAELVCETKYCGKKLDHMFHMVVYGQQTAKVCSFPCAIKFSKERGEGISTHIKVGKLEPEKKVK